MHHLGIRLATALAIGLLNAAVRVPSATAETQGSTDAELPIAIDAGSTLGEIRPLHDLHSAPLTTRSAIDLSEFYRELGVRYVRIHDTPWTFDNAVDMHMIFPRFEADPDDPDNYFFDKTDEVVDSVKRIGGEVIFRLGESAELANRRHNRPPADFEKWVRIATNIVRHYNEGWANGFRLDIQYWEIWNEPDIPNFWTGTPEEYYRLYEMAARAIKAIDPRLRVGGPALAARLDFLEGFLRHCRDRDVPLDFVSWHSYSVAPSAVAERARHVRALVDRYGFADAQTMLTEWSYFPGDWDRLHVEPRYTRDVFDEIHGAPGAAYAASLLAYLQDTPLDVANFYTGTTMWYGLFDTHGVPHRTFYAFRAFRRLLDTPIRIAAQGSDGDALAVLAGRAQDGTAVSALIANLRRPCTAYRIALRNLPWQGPTRYELYLVDADRDLNCVQEGVLEDGELRLTEGVTPPSVLFLRCLEAEPEAGASPEPRP